MLKIVILVHYHFVENDVNVKALTSKDTEQTPNLPQLDKVSPNKPKSAWGNKTGAIEKSFADLLKSPENKSSSIRAEEIKHVVRPAPPSSHNKKASVSPNMDKHTAHIAGIVTVSQYVSE